jgi:hypothetical protein
VHGIDALVVGEVGTEGCAAVDEPQPSGVDELLEDPREERREVVVHRVHLHDRDGALGEQHVE